MTQRLKEDASPAINYEPIADDHFAYDAEDRETGRSDFMAFLFGGVVVAGGLLAFLYYDGGDPLGGPNRLTTGSLSSISSPNVAPAPSIAITGQPAEQHGG